jgi:ABC-2 type transport system permease protein
MKNMLIWVLAGELVPLDLYPEPVRTWLLHSPFASGVYVPVSYITGRVGTPFFLQSFISISGGLVVFGAIAYVLWWRGVRSYTGTGA